MLVLIKKFSGSIDSSFTLNLALESTQTKKQADIKNLQTPEGSLEILTQSISVLKN